MSITMPAMTGRTLIAGAHEIAECGAASILFTDNIFSMFLKRIILVKC